MKDKRGVQRGKCSLCECEEFVLDSTTISCGECGHPPTKHQNLDKTIATSKVEGDSEDLKTPTLPKLKPLERGINEDSQDTSNKCLYLGCTADSTFDINTGESSIYCETHKDVQTQHGFTVGSIPLFPIPFPIPFPLPRCKLPGCNQPCFVDKTSDKVYEFCRKQHGIDYHQMNLQNRYTSGQLPQSSIPEGLKCTNPWCDRQRYQENGTLFDFCGITCRNYFQKQQSIGQSNGGISHVQLSQCLLPGCKLSCAVDGNMKVLFEFCGNVHKSQAEGQVLLELQSDHKRYLKVQKNFTTQWVKNPPAPQIVMVFKVFNPKQKLVFQKHMKNLSSKQVEKHYHGTIVKCDLRQQKKACSDSKCGICGISRRGFDRSLIASNIPRFTRFGKGFYLAPNSSKCHDYTQGIVDYRVMLLCHVATGNKYICKNDQITLTGPPQGYDSVYGAKGGALNYDEIVLYQSESILPKYAIIYQKGGIGKIAK